MAAAPKLPGASCLVSCFEATPNPYRLWVGSFSSSLKLANLQAAGITHVLTAAEEFPPKFPAELEYLHVQLRDETHWNILTALPQVIPWIDAAIGDPSSPHRLLIHCAQGSSRSGSMAVAYLMMSQKLGFDDALTQARRDRALIQPNPGFEEQLRHLATELQLDLSRVDPTAAFLQAYRYAPEIVRSSRN